MEPEMIDCLEPMEPMEPSGPDAELPAIADAVTAAAEKLSALGLPTRCPGRVTGYGSPAYRATVTAHELRDLADRIRELSLPDAEVSK